MEIHNYQNTYRQNLLKNNENKVLAQKLHRIKRRMLRQIGTVPMDRINKAPSILNEKDMFNNSMTIEEEYEHQ